MVTMSKTPSCYHGCNVQNTLLFSREIQKFGLVYIAKGQEKRDEILGNNIGSSEFEAFVGGLGWEMNWQDLQGFLPTIGKGGNIW